MKKQFVAAGLILSGLAAIVTPSCNCAQKETSCIADSVTCCAQKAPFKKKYTNADYYKDGKLIPEVALQAYLEMFEHYGVEYNEFLKANMFVTDFDLGDFENVGMAGVFWVNDPVGGYVGHNIYLLPGQAIIEHRHLKTTFPAKIESWYIEHGSCYNFSIGEPTTGYEAIIPASQRDVTTIKHFTQLCVGDTASLVRPESPHFLMGAENGAVIIEAGNYHDNSGLRFANSKAIFSDALTPLKKVKTVLQQ